MCSHQDSVWYHLCCARLAVYLSGERVEHTQPGNVVLAGVTANRLCHTGKLTLHQGMVDHSCSATHLRQGIAVQPMSHSQSCQQTTVYKDLTSLHARLNGLGQHRTELVGDR